MKKMIVGIGLLAGGTALTGLAGSAYAQNGTAVKDPAVVAKAQGPDAVAKGGGPVAIVCTKKGGPIKGKPGKVRFSLKSDGKLPAARAKKAFMVRGGASAIPAKPGEKGTVMLKEAPGQVKLGPPPKLGPPSKSADCVRVKPGDLGSPPPLPAR
jgi:hypothetical protein